MDRQLITNTEEKINPIMCKQIIYFCNIKEFSISKKSI